MKRLVFCLALAAFAITSARAQSDDSDNHHGPVVYPANSAPETQMAPDTNAAPAPDSAAAQSFASNAAPAAPEGNPVTMPPADASAMTAPAPSSTTPSPDASSTPATPSDASSDNAASSPDALVHPLPGSGPQPPSTSMNPALAPLQGLASTPGATGGQADDIYDIRPPYFYLKPLTWLWVLLGVLAAIALAMVLWIWLKPLRILRPKSAYELALEKLEKARALLNENNPEPYAVLVSETIRNYLGQRFHTPSTRRTTEEFLRQMQADTNTPLAEHRDLLRGFLEACDLVKFAHYQPGRDELEQVQQRAVSFVTATRPAEGVPA
jgi:hypothetical protein